MDSFQVLPFGALLFCEPEKRLVVYGALFSGCARRQWENEEQSQLVPELCRRAWHLGIRSIYSEQLGRFGTTFQFEDPLTPARGSVLARTFFLQANQVLTPTEPESRLQKESCTEKSSYSHTLTCLGVHILRGVGSWYDKWLERFWLLCSPVQCIEMLK